MGLGKFADSVMPVIDDLVGVIGDESRITDLPFAIEEPLVSCRFPLSYCFDDLIQLCFFTALSP
jgi:hypothetical protein